jgi:hypothetical protein
MTTPLTIFCFKFPRGLFYDIMVSDRTGEISAGFGMTMGRLYFGSKNFMTKITLLEEKTEFYRKLQEFIYLCEVNEAHDEFVHEVASNSGYCEPEELSEKIIGEQSVV